MGGILLVKVLEVLGAGKHRPSDDGVSLRTRVVEEFRSSGSESTWGRWCQDWLAWFGDKQKEAVDDAEERKKEERGRESLTREYRVFRSAVNESMLAVAPSERILERSYLGIGLRQRLVRLDQRLSVLGIGDLEENGAKTLAARRRACFRGSGGGHDDCLLSRSVYVCSLLCVLDCICGWEA